jgi:hypothetical protein
MRRVSIHLFTVLALSVSAMAGTSVAAPVDAAAAKAKGARAKGPKPKILRVTPMRVQVGEVLVIRGRNFKGKRRRNTVVFTARGGRTAFVKPRRATRRKLVVKVPAKVARLLTLRDGAQRPTRLRLRVLAGRFSSFTPRRLSPVVLGLGGSSGGPGGGGGGGEGGEAPLQVCNSDSDHDNDLLGNQLEISIGTDPCLADTDSDRLADGWEYYSAKDLNVKAVPYPGKRPFPNALDPTDAEIDFDGDGLLAAEEYRAWTVTGSSFDPGRVGGAGADSPLGYSDGTQTSRPDETPAVPAWRGPAFGQAVPAHPFPATYDLHGDVDWRDDERDADRDGLSNWIESARGPGRPEWWAAYWAVPEHKVEPWAKPIPGCDQAPGAFTERPFASLDLANGDVDGDTLLDGEDDQDNDDISNIVELYETVIDADSDGQAACGYSDIPTWFLGAESRVVNAFNPCAPDPVSRTCPRYSEL